MDFYGILGIPKDADQETIRSAYRILASRYHPDRGAGSSTEKFRQVAEAYETLIDPSRRQGYDLSRMGPRRVAEVRVEPMTASPELSHQEDPSVFGRFERTIQRTPLRRRHGVDDLSDEVMGSVVVLYGLLWRW
jgi:DnaJ-class molecular chaperone